MSEKWRRSKAWDDRFFPKWAWPAKALLRAFSSIPLAVALLGGVALFGISASVPIGMLALAPTFVVYGLTVVAAVLVIAGLPLVVVRRVLRDAPRATRFAVLFLGGLALIPFAVATWHRVFWPMLHYDPVSGEGVRFFAEFCERYAATTLRRLPGLEMSELEYYAWWPMPTLLGLFVVNMVTATVRRIEFNFKNIGVLTVHSGIVVIALGSVYYNGLKLEGDTLLLAGEVNPTSGKPGVGPHQFVFYDNTDTALYVDQFRGWEQRPLRGVPRYNDYNLDVLGPDTAWNRSGKFRPWTIDEEGRPMVERGLSVPVIQPPPGQSTVDGDLRFRIVGYSSYAKPEPDWVPVTDPRVAALPATADEGPLRLVYLHSDLPDDEGRVNPRDPMFVFTLAPFLPKDRIATSMDDANNPILSIEYTMGETMGMSEERWRDVTEAVPTGTRHALVVEVPSGVEGEKIRRVVPIAAQRSFDVAGYTFDVTQVSSVPTFPIITKGFENASSAMAVVRVTTPGGGGVAGKRFERWVYARFPQINQDLEPDEVGANGMPRRGPPDPSVRIALIETDHLAVFIDEPRPGVTRAAVRLPDGTVRTYDALEEERPEDGGDGGPLGGKWLHEIVPKIDLRVGDRMERAARVERPTTVATRDRERQFVGTHDKAMLAVEVRVESGPPGPDDGEFRRVVWLPFSKYMGDGLGQTRSVTLPGADGGSGDGRVIRLGFGRVQHPFPNFELRLVDFEMIAYDHRGAPRDYQSIIRVTPTDESFDQYEHVTKLNAPLMAPFHWSEERGFAENLVLRLASGLSPRQFKLSQAGWDRTGWDETQALADQGVLPGPHAKFTILGVGNNPGIHVIAFGAVLIGMGIPWAFYVKPWLVKRESERIRAAIAAGTYVRPAAGARGGASGRGGGFASGGAT
jgi:hypothetical protein